MINLSKVIKFFAFRPFIKVFIVELSNHEILLMVHH